MWYAAESTGASVVPSDMQHIVINDTVAKHCVFMLYDCGCVRLDDESILRSASTNAAVRVGPIILQLITHHSNPVG